MTVLFKSIVFILTELAIISWVSILFFNLYISVEETEDLLINKCLFRCSARLWR